jgi:hypothetical protein
VIGLVLFVLLLVRKNPDLGELPPRPPAGESCRLPQTPSKRFDLGEAKRAPHYLRPGNRSVGELLTELVLKIFNDNLAPPLSKGRLGGVWIYASRQIYRLGFILQPNTSNSTQVN